MAKQASKTYQMDLCTGPILGKLLRFSLPLMLSSVLQLLFNAADVVVVGRFAGDNSLAAVGSTGSIVNLVVNLFVGLSIGANVLAARSAGAALLRAVGVPPGAAAAPGDAELNNEPAGRTSCRFGCYCAELCRNQQFLQRIAPLTGLRCWNIMEFQQRRRAG